MEQGPSHERATSQQAGIFSSLRLAHVDDTYRIVKGGSFTLGSFTLGSWRGKGEARLLSYE